MLTFDASNTDSSKSAIGALRSFLNTPLTYSDALLDRFMQKSRDGNSIRIEHWPADEWQDMYNMLENLHPTPHDCRIDFMSECDSRCTTIYPNWPDVESAIRRMDRKSHTSVQLHTSGTPIEAGFSILGGDGLWCLLGLKFEWELDLPFSGDDWVCVWAEMDHDCPLSRTTDDLHFTPELAKKYFDTSSFSAVQLVENNYKKRLRTTGG